MLEEGLAEYLALVRPLDALLDDIPLTPSARARHDPSFVVEVAQHDQQSLIFFAKHVARGNLDVIERDKGGSSGGRVGGLDRLGGDALAALDEEDGETLGGLACYCEVVGEVAVGDPPIGSKSLA